MFSAYPKQLTDPTWKKVEKAGGVSGTGVGQTLRDAEKHYQALAVRMQALEAGKTDPGAVKPAKVAAAAALHKSAKTVLGLVPKIKSEDKKKFIKTYGDYVEHIASELDDMELDDRRGLKTPLDRYNDRVKMWNKWVGI